MTILASGTLEEKAKLTFRAIDKDSSGTISKSEFTSYAAKAIGLKHDSGKPLSFNFISQLTEHLEKSGLAKLLGRGTLRMLSTWKS